MAQHLVVVGVDLAAAGKLVKPLIPAVAVDSVAAQRIRVHTVIRRRLVQPDEGIDAGPVSAGLLAGVDERDRGRGLGEQRVNERHPHGARPHDQIIHIDGVHHRQRLRLLATPT
jgi:hypothetical protein